MFRNGYQSWSPTGGGDPRRRRRSVLARPRAGARARRRTTPTSGRRRRASCARELVTVLADDGPDAGAGRLRRRRAATTARSGCGGPATGRCSRSRRSSAARSSRPASVAGAARRSVSPTGEDHARAARGLGRRARGGVGGGPRRRAVPGRLVLLVPLLRRRDRGRPAGEPGPAAEAGPSTSFQLDDGYQPTIGDWLTTQRASSPPTSTRSPTRIAAAGRRPGLWIAPFVARPDCAGRRASTRTGSPGIGRGGRG